MSVKCQRCNNRTKNPSGLCHLHEGQAGTPNRDMGSLSALSSRIPTAQAEGSVVEGENFYDQSVYEKWHKSFGRISSAGATSFNPDLPHESDHRETGYVGRDGQIRPALVVDHVQGDENGEPKDMGPHAVIAARDESGHNKLTLVSMQNAKDGYTLSGSDIDIAEDGGVSLKDNLSSGASWVGALAESGELQDFADRCEVP